MNNSLFVEGTLVESCNNFGTDLVSTTVYPTTLIEVGDFKSFAFLVKIGATANITTWQVEQCKTNNNSDSSEKDVTGAVLVAAATDDNKWLIIEVNTENLDSNNGFHFVGLKQTGGTTGDFAQIIFLGRGSGIQAVTQPTGFLSSIAVAG